MCISTILRPSIRPSNYPIQPTCTPPYLSKNQTNTNDILGYRYDIISCLIGSRPKLTFRIIWGETIVTVMSSSGVSACGTPLAIPNHPTQRSSIGDSELANIICMFSQLSNKSESGSSTTPKASIRTNLV